MTEQTSILQKKSKSDLIFAVDQNEEERLWQMLSREIESAVDELHREKLSQWQIDKKTLGIMTTPIDRQTVREIILNEKEDSINILVNTFVKQNRAEDCKELFLSLRPLFDEFRKARLAKIARHILDEMSLIPDTLDMQIAMCLECIQWCTAEKRNLFRYRIEAKLISLYYQSNQLKSAVKMLPPLFREIKKLDDKFLLVELLLLESKVYFALKHMPRTKGAIVACRSLAGQIHCPPLVQADIDLVAGCIYAEENDYQTAYSYFYESFEGFGSQKDFDRQTRALKYMMLCRIATNQGDELTNFGRNNSALNLLEKPDVSFLISLGKSYKTKNLEKFTQLLTDKRNYVDADPVLVVHVDTLASELLEQNLMKIIEPYSRIQISRLAELTKIPLETIEQKLAEMILDNKLNGTLDQQNGNLIVFDEEPVPPLFADVIDSLGNLSAVVDVLSKKAVKIL